MRSSAEATGQVTDIFNLFLSLAMANFEKMDFRPLTSRCTAPSIFSVRPISPIRPVLNVR
jgi:hypothetical protein